MEYPEKAKKDSIEGTVYVRFVVGKDGKVGRIEAVNEAHPELVDAALEVFEGMPDWEPGMKDGKKVPVELFVPVKFTL